MDAIIRAIDVGYRRTKYIGSAKGAQMICRSFPSVAPVACARDIAAALGHKRRTVAIRVGPLDYEVGPDAELAEPTYPLHNLHDDYVTSDEYLALVRGALHYMRVERIDWLVVGLPVSNFARRKGDLEKRLKGSHEVGRERPVTVERVKVLAQPYGALMAYALGAGRYQQVRELRHLIIDCGGRTFDWLVTEGLKVVDKRSHAVNRGMYDVTLSIAEAIGKKLNVQYHDLGRIDQALRTRSPLRIHDEDHDLAAYLPAAEKIAREAAAEMKRYIRDGSDLDNIVLAGGGAFFFREAIAEVFPRRQLQELEDPMYANVRGFQLAGHQWVARQGRLRAVPSGSEGIDA